MSGYEGWDVTGVYEVKPHRHEGWLRRALALVRRLLVWWLYGVVMLALGYLYGVASA